MEDRITREVVGLDGLKYALRVRRVQPKPPDAVRLLIPAYQPNETASRILRACITSIQKFTHPDDYEMWVTDSNSPSGRADWLLDVPGINVVLSGTEPRPTTERAPWRRAAFWRNQTKWGSYANAAGLELGIRLIAPQSRLVMTLHMDVMVCHHNWLGYLRSKLTSQTLAVGVCMERHRIPEGVLHVLGCLFDHAVARKLGVDFFPAFPMCDTGDRITVALREAGYGVFACQNTYENPEYAERIEPGSLLRHLNVVRVFDDAWNVIFMHLGRGIPKAGQRYSGKTASAEEWIRLGAELAAK
jgi:hypothetical protein